MVACPLCKNDTAKTVRKVSPEKIQRLYRRQIKLDVSKFFQNVESVDVMECSDCNFHFYTPAYIAGDGDFYRNLQKFDWYYHPWKWEHDVARSQLKEHDKILEVGSGGLGFLERITGEGYDITGLELNEDSIVLGEKKQVKVLPEMVQEHADRVGEFYDVVCSFQVLEHIADVHGFLEGKVKCLKKGGKLIVAVPNNDSFIRLDPFHIMNMPPHHMGLWTETSLRSIEKHFPLKAKQFFIEPLKDSQINLYYNITTYGTGYRKKYWVRGLQKFGLFNRWTKHIRENLETITGLSIVAVYEKQ